MLIGLEGMISRGSLWETYAMPKKGANMAMTRPRENCIFSALELETRNRVQKEILGLE